MMTHPLRLYFEHTLIQITSHDNTRHVIVKTQVNHQAYLGLATSELESLPPFLEVT